MINIFINPDVFEQWICGEDIDQDDITLDPSQIDQIKNFEELNLELSITSKTATEIIKGTFCKNVKGVDIRIELVNCTPAEKIRLIHKSEQLLKAPF